MNTQNQGLKTTSEIKNDLVHFIQDREIKNDFIFLYGVTRIEYHHAQKILVIEERTFDQHQLEVTENAEH